MRSARSEKKERHPMYSSTIKLHLISTLHPPSPSPPIHPTHCLSLILHYQIASFLLSRVLCTLEYHAPQIKSKQRNPTQSNPTHFLALPIKFRLKKKQKKAQKKTTQYFL